MKNFHGKVALITGSTSGIGLAVAHKLASQGARVVIHGLLAQKDGELICGELAEHTGGTASYHRADLRNPEEISALIGGVSEDAGEIDILINNAGVQHVSPIQDFAVECWNDMLAVNLSAPFHTIRLCVPAMKKKGWGRIVNVASISGLRGRAEKPGYNATKHGLIGLTKSVALELAGYDITCNALCPGWALTPIVQKQIESFSKKNGMDFSTATRELVSLRQPSGRLVKVEHLASLVMFLCSDEAAEVRGAAWTMDGGTTAQ